MSSINVNFMKRITTGPYEHEEMSVQFSVDSRDLLESTTRDYRDFVYRTLGKPTSVIEPQTLRTPTTPSATSSQGEENGKSNKESSKESSSKKSSKKSSSKGSEEEVSSTASSEEMEEVPSPYTKSTESSEPSKEETKTTKPKKAAKEDGIPYDCDKDEHKSTLTNFLTKLTGGKEWSKDKERSRKISREVLHGQPFLAKDGSILPTFSNLCKENYGVTQDVL